MKDNTTSIVLFGSMRIPFLVLTPTCVAIGIATAYNSGIKPDILGMVLVAIGAICAHISVNALNEYDDFKSGLDYETEQTPFSGGSKTLPENPEKARVALYTGIITLGITSVIGLYFFYKIGLAILPIGILGLLIIVTYTKWITHNPLLCLIAPGLGFGSLMVMGTHVALTGQYSWASFAASFIPFFFVSGLLLLNQLPDVEADRATGRKHMPIAIGKKNSALLYGVLIICAFLSIAASWFFTRLPVQSLIALAGIALAVPTVVGAIKNAESTEKLIQFMGMNVALILLTNILFVVGIFLGQANI